ncbi:hypothetical protein GCM10023318_47980 [Nocardia callitridis]|uniref:ABC transporter ATP-binding protein n=2 Tax=Nocardia callitridis TaxID=648753 RepID=A0ABP9KTI7_9NOCA
MDKSLAEYVLDYLDAYRRESAAAVVSISHDLNSQLQRTDHLAVVDGGEIIEFGATEQLRRNPHTALLQRLLAAGGSAAVARHAASPP